MLSHLFNKIHESLCIGTYYLSGDKKGPKIGFSFADPESCVIIYDETIGAEVPVHIAGACTDRFKKPYLSIAKYYNAGQMKKKHGFKALPNGFDKEKELIQEIDCEWVELSEIVNYCYVLCVDRDEYKRIFIDSELKSNELLFTDQTINNPEIELIKIFSSPLKPKGWYRDTRASRG